MTAAANTLTVRIPLTVCRRGGARKVVVPAGVLPMPPQADVTLIKALAWAFRCQSRRNAQQALLPSIG